MYGKYIVPYDTVVTQKVFFNIKLKLKLSKFPALLLSKNSFHDRTDYRTSIFVIYLLT